MPDINTLKPKPRRRKRLSPRQRERAEGLLKAVAELQSALWTTLGQLEHLVRADIDSTQDFDGLTLEQVMEDAEIW